MRKLVHTSFLIGVLISIACNRQPPIAPRSNLVMQEAPAQKSVQSLITSLLSADTAVRTKSETDLIHLGQQSSIQRDDVIQKLLQSVDRQDDLKNGRCIILGSKFNYWDSITNIFGELKATEAIDVLITTIACGNGYTGSLLKEPSMDALIKLGNITVPKLSKALKREHNEYVRIQLSHCLSIINYHQGARNGL